MIGMTLLCAALGLNRPKGLLGQGSRSRHLLDAVKMRTKKPQAARLLRLTWNLWWSHPAYTCSLAHLQLVVDTVNCFNDRLLSLHLPQEVLLIRCPFHRQRISQDFLHSKTFAFQCQRKLGPMMLRCLSGYVHLRLSRGLPQCLLHYYFKRCSMSWTVRSSCDAYDLVQPYRITRKYAMSVSEKVQERSACST